MKDVFKVVTMKVSIEISRLGASFMKFDIHLKSMECENAQMARLFNVSLDQDQIWKKRSFFYLPVVWQMWVFEHFLILCYFLSLIITVAVVI